MKKTSSSSLLHISIVDDDKHWIKHAQQGHEGETWGKHRFHFHLKNNGAERNARKVCSTIDKSRLLTFNFSSCRSKYSIQGRIIAQWLSPWTMNEPNLRFWTLSAASLTVSFWRSTAKKGVLNRWSENAHLHFLLAFSTSPFNRWYFSVR